MISQISTVDSSRSAPCTTLLLRQGDDGNEPEAAIKPFGCVFFFFSNINHHQSELRAVSTIHYVGQRSDGAIAPACLMGPTWLFVGEPASLAGIGVRSEAEEEEVVVKSKLRVCVCASHSEASCSQPGPSHSHTALF